MTSSLMESGALVSLQDLHPFSPYFKQGTSLRVTGKLQEFSVETAIATVVDGNDSLKIDTKNLRELSIRVGSMYQFIGELLIQPDNEAVLQARVGRNVDGIDVNLYHQSLQLLRQFQANHLKNPSAQQSSSLGRLFVEFKEPSKTSCKSQTGIVALLTDLTYTCCVGRMVFTQVQYSWSNQATFFKIIFSIIMVDKHHYLTQYV